jgi:cytochrome c2
MKPHLQIAISAACFTLSATASAAPAGQTYFDQNCASCHTVDPALTSRAGPGLFNVINRKAAGVPNFNYTDALAKAGAAGKTWTPKNSTSSCATRTRTSPVPPCRSASPTPRHAPP